jgi:uncharacterized phage protein (TIGR01671 family)
MREFKFRAWYDTTKTMYYFTFEDIYHDGFMHGISEGSDVWGFEKKEIMQYVGMRDKNGEEIYEGDIIKMDEKYIKYYKGNDLIKQITRNIFTINFLNYGWFPFSHAYPMPEDIEIKGNIHENPDLLDETLQ